MRGGGGAVTGGGGGTQAPWATSGVSRPSPWGNHGQACAQEMARSQRLWEAADGRGSRPLGAAVSACGPLGRPDLSAGQACGYRQPSPPSWPTLAPIIRRLPHPGVASRHWREGFEAGAPEPWGGGWRDRPGWTRMFLPERPRPGTWLARAEGGTWWEPGLGPAPPEAESGALAGSELQADPGPEG